MPVARFFPVIFYFPLALFLIYSSNLSVFNIKWCRLWEAPLFPTACILLIGCQFEVYWLCCIDSSFQARSSGHHVIAFKIAKKLKEMFSHLRKKVKSLLILIVKMTALLRKICWLYPLLQYLFVFFCFCKSQLFCFH